MKKFKVKLPSAFIKSLENIPRNITPKILSALKILEDTPFPSGKPRIKKVKGFKPPLYRLRVGDYRVLYRIERDVVVVLKILDRKELEKELKKMLR